MAFTDRLGTPDSAPGTLVLGFGTSVVIPPSITVTTALGFEAFHKSTGAAAISAIGVEAFVTNDANSRTSAMGVEVFIQGAINMKVAALGVEVFVPVVAGPPGNVSGGPWIGDGGGGSIWVE